jgi:1,4-dihydroxy-2-naphthoyl-CoA hydrolase
MLIFAFLKSGHLLKLFLSQICGDLVRLNAMHQDNLAGQLGIEMTSVGPGFISGAMPVDSRTIQPFGILHGGASIVLAETLGSVASYLLVSASDGARVAGIEVSGSHLRAVSSGQVHGLCKPAHIGRTLHFWQVDIRDDQGRLCCTAKLTVSVSFPGPDALPARAS